MRRKMRKSWPYVVFPVILLFGVSFFYEENLPVVEVAPAPIVEKVTSEPFVSIGDLSIPVEIATTTKAIRKGLSGRDFLEADKGMLFLFSKPDIYRFWMLNMQFPLDIIWIDAEGKKIVDISAHAENTFDPAKPVFYRPSSLARYVLEVNAGFAKSRGLEPGDAVQFNNINN